MGREIIDENEIIDLINRSERPDKNKARGLLQKSLQLKGLLPSEAAFLLNIDDDELLSELFITAKRIKDEIYGNRLVLFTPLYVSNHCCNDCLYCGFRVRNENIERRQLTLDEIKEETLAILEQGHKRILLLMGETPEQDFLDYLIKLWKLYIPSGIVKEIVLGGSILR